MARHLIDAAAVLRFLEVNPGATALDIKTHMGATITGIRSKLKKMWIAGEIERVKQKDGAYRFSLRAAPTWGSATKHILTSF